MQIIDKNTLDKTCGACPAQWEGKTKDLHDVYIRLRHGYFYVEINDERVFEGEPDGFDGVMNNDEMINYVESNSEIRFQ